MRIRETEPHNSLEVKDPIRHRKKTHFYRVWDASPRRRVMWTDSSTNALPLCQNHSSRLVGPLATGPEKGWQHQLPKESHSHSTGNTQTRSDPFKLSLLKEQKERSYLWGRWSWLARGMLSTSNSEQERSPPAPFPTTQTPAHNCISAKCHEKYF